MVRPLVRCFRALSSSNVFAPGNLTRFVSSATRPRSDPKTRSASAAPLPQPSLIETLIKRAETKEIEISAALSSRGWACVDSFMGADACVAMRLEADRLLKVWLGVSEETAGALPVKGAETTPSDVAGV